MAIVAMVISVALDGRADKKATGLAAWALEVGLPERVPEAEADLPESEVRMLSGALRKTQPTLPFQF